MLWIAALVLWTLGWLFVIGLCLAAKRGDEIAEQTSVEFNKHVNQAIDIANRKAS